MATFTTIATVVKLERMNRSVNGNPRFRVFLDTGHAYPTSPDSGLAYGIENPEYRDFYHEFTIDGHGNITTATKVSK